MTQGEILGAVQAGSLDPGVAADMLMYIHAEERRRWSPRYLASAWLAKPSGLSNRGLIWYTAAILIGLRVADAIRLAVWP